MSKERYQSAKEIFLVACQKTGDARRAFVEEACQDDTALLAEVQGLLDLDSDPIDTQTNSAPRDNGAATIAVENYRLLGQIGHGGMGLVYEAEQLAPVRRRVALKLIKPGMDSERVLARFDSERQALARMDHPNIARVLDAGMTELGRPFFAMELVKGIPLDHYCDAQRLGIRKRLELFIDICSGVQHAHQKGVIHRDLKPSNVLVTVDGEEVIPKIIDFGVAKAISDPLTDHTVYTELGQVIGTPEFMSPEQAELTGLDIDTRSDVYALGVLLYLLLVGETPFEASQLRRMSFPEVCRVIREEEPTRPSTRIRGADAERAEVVRARGSSALQLHRELRGDIDWIIMRALEKDRTRRYSSASELAEDLKRHLRNEPVLAGPPSWRYRFSKFVQRNRIAVAATTAILVTLIGALASTSLSLIRAWDAEERALGSAKEARSAETRALSAEKIARQEAASARQAEQTAREQAESAKQVADFLISVYKASDPRVAESRDLTAKEVLDANVAGLLEGLQDQPRVRATLLTALGQVYHSLGALETADQLLSEAIDLKRKHTDAAQDDFHETLLALASLESQRGDFDAMETLAKESLAKHVADTTSPHLQPMAKLRLAHAVRMKGDPAAAEGIARASLEELEQLQGKESIDVAHACYLMGEILTDLGRFAAAEPFARRALDLRRRLSGDKHPSYSTSLASVGVLLKDLNKYDQARPLLEKALRLDREALGENHPEVSTGIYNLGSLLHSMRLFAEAEPLLEECLRRDREQLGRHLYVSLSMNNLGGTLTAQGKYERAEQMYKDALALQRELFDGPHPEIATTCNNYGRLCNLMRRYPEAEALYRQSLDIRRKVFGDKNPRVATSLNSLATNLQAQNRIDEALECLEEGLAIRRAAFPDGHSMVGTSLVALADNRLRAKQLDKAEEYAREALEIHRATLPPRHLDSAHSVTAMARVFGAREQWTQALPFYREAHGIREAVLPKRHLRLANSKRHLGHCLGKLEKFTEAEPLLLQALEIYIADYGPDHDATARLYKDLAEFYVRWGKPTEATKYGQTGS